MSAEIIFVFLLLFVIIVVFVIDKFRMDLVALTVLTVLAVSGIITPAEAVSGFGNSVVLMIAGLFVVGEALMLTGVASAIGNWLLRVGGNGEIRLLCLLLPVVALLSAFMSSTGAVALLIPVVMSMAKKANLRVSMLLMPLSFSALMGGMLTLIGTPPNIVASEQMQAFGFKGFDFFDFTPIGLAIFVTGMLYLLTVGRLLLPSYKALQPEQQSSLIEFMHRYQISEHLHRVVVNEDSPMIGRSVADFRPRRDFEVTPFAARRKGKRLTTLLPVLLNTKIQAGDILWVYATIEDLQQFSAALSVNVLAGSNAERQTLNRRYGVVEVLIPPYSHYENKTLFEGGLGINMG